MTLALLAFLLVQAGEVPPHDGWITDRAGFLTEAQERELEALAESYRAGSGHEIAVLTVPDLGGRALEEFALEAGRSWGIGREEENDGALLVAARAEHALRIEVGRGLEGTLTDSISGRIIRDVIVPEFRSERYYEGLRAGLRAMHAAAGGDYGPLEDGPGARSRGTPAAGLVLVVLLILVAWLARRRRRLGGSTWGGSALPWILASELGRAGRSSRSYSGGFGGRAGGGGFRGFGGGGGFSGGGASGRW
jgi:uncharacterized protein